MTGGLISPVPSLTAEQERDQYKEKVEHFKVLIKKLQDELQTYKIRREGTETVSKLLQESKHETAALKKKNSQYEAVIRNLQTRLETNGLSSDVVLQEGETYIPGQSKKLLDNLTRENNRLRHIVRSKSGDPEEFAKLQQYNEELLEERTRLQTHIAELEQILRSSDVEKDKVITDVREQLAHAQRELASRDTLVQSLSQESRVLQKQLMDVAHQCQELARKLNEQGTNTEKVERETIQKKAAEVDPSLLDENKMLNQKVKEITEMNRRWQEFNAQREETLTKTTNEAKRLQSRVNELEKKGATWAHETQVEMNRVLDESRRMTRVLGEQKKQLSHCITDRDKYKRALGNAHDQIHALKEEVQRYKGVASGGGRGNDSGDATEIINALKAQIQICTEDFESERRDRERGAARITRMETEMDQLRKENENQRRTIQHFHTIQSQPMDPAYHCQGQVQNFSYEKLEARGAQNYNRNLDKYNVVDSPRAADVTDCTQRPNFDAGPNIETHEPLRVPDTPVRRADVTHAADDQYVSLNASSISLTSNDSDHSKERASPKPNDSPRKRQSDSEYSPQNSPAPKTTQPGVLQCPKCAKAYLTTEHPELLDHMESCI